MAWAFDRRRLATVPGNAPAARGCTNSVCPLIKHLDRGDDSSAFVVNRGSFHMNPYAVSSLVQQVHSRISYLPVSQRAAQRIGDFRKRFSIFVTVSNHAVSIWTPDYLLAAEARDLVGKGIPIDNLAIRIYNVN